MVAARKNTLVFDFSVLPVRPTPEEIENFVCRVVKLDTSSIKNLQLHNLRRCVFIEMRTLEAAENVTVKHNLKHYIEVDSKKI